MNKKLALVVLGLLSLVLVFSGCTSNNTQNTGDSNTDMSWKNVQDSGVLKVGLCAAYPPFESRNEKTGEFEGFDIDFANAIGEELGVKVEIIDAEWPALLGGLSKGDYDTLITCMSERETSAENVEMSEPYYALTDVVVVNKETDSINSLNDLSGKVVGAQLGTGSQDTAEGIEGVKEVVTYNYNPEAFIDLENGRVDAVIVGQAYALTQMKEYENVKATNITINPVNVITVQKSGAVALTDKMNEAINKLKENGKYDEIKEKWLAFE
ncbi:ABC transporter substrate-binding protein [Methanococcus voltae]|uniref:ABC transporter substrate-binding protein n=1 Tax=Methanococcus voltae TaxID=2188 RepID=UPI00015ECB6F|nr:polar amino acid transport system substrate-binding protein [Methanococcus voltae]